MIVCSHLPSFESIPTPQTRISGKNGNAACLLDIVNPAATTAQTPEKICTRATHPAPATAPATANSHNSLHITIYRRPTNSHRLPTIPATNPAINPATIPARSPTKTARPPKRRRARPFQATCRFLPSATSTRNEIAAKTAISTVCLVIAPLSPTAIPATFRQYLRQHILQPLRPSPFHHHRLPRTSQKREHPHVRRAYHPQPFRQYLRQHFRQYLRTSTATPSPHPSPHKCMPGSGHWPRFQPPADLRQQSGNTSGNTSGHIQDARTLSTMWPTINMTSCVASADLPTRRDCICE